MMNDVVYYATPRLVQEYVVERYRCAHVMTSFPDALIDLKNAGALPHTPLPVPPFLDNMTTEEFDSFLLDLPFNASNIVENDRRLKGEGTRAETGMFPWSRDVFMIKHMPYMDERLHAHDYFEITYLYHGACRLLFENESLPLAEGEMCIIPPMSPHNQPLEPGCLAIGIEVRKSTFDSIFGGLLTQNDLVSSFFRNSLYGSTQANYLILKTELLPNARSLLQQLANECGRDDPYSNACSISILQIFLAQTLRRYSDTITIYRMDDYAHRHNDFAVILQYIQQNFRTVTLSSLAAAFHYSETYLCKLIQHSLNQSFTAIVRSLKMARAQDYVQNTALKVGEIADLVGYDSVDHFSRTFKKTFGVSPREYRLMTGTAMAARAEDTE